LPAAYNLRHDVMHDMARSQNTGADLNANAARTEVRRKPPESPDAFGFQGTIWTQVKAAGTADQEIRQAALDRLLTKYQAPLKAFLGTRFGWRPRVNPGCLEDWFQSFIERKVMLRGIIETADRSRGRFRDLLKTALWNFAMQEYRALLRRIGPEVELETEGVDGGTTEQHECPEAEKAWARRVFIQALQQLEADCKQGNHQLTWIIFLRRRLFPLAGKEPAESLEQTVAHVLQAYGQVLTPQQVSNRQKTAEQKLSRYIRDVLAEYCRNAEDIEEELLGLIDILKGGVSLPTRLRPPQPASQKPKPLT
jgi:hypothetical protein